MSEIVYKIADLCLKVVRPTHGAFRVGSKAAMQRLLPIVGVGLPATQLISSQRSFMTCSRRPRVDVRRAFVNSRYAVEADAWKGATLGALPACIEGIKTKTVHGTWSTPTPVVRTRSVDARLVPGVKAVSDTSVTLPYAEVSKYRSIRRAKRTWCQPT